jgi:methionine synthase I (cobalamin-dependent)
MHALVEQLLAEAPVITDGAWGTQLQARGLAPGECPDLWNLTKPDLVFEVARAYVDAGSRVILSNTFSANRITLARHDAADRAAQIARAGVEISRRAAAGRAYVFASLGPSGKMVIAGDVTEDELLAAFREAALGLKAGGADGIVVETMSETAEAVAAVKAARETGLPVAVCMVFDCGKNKDRTMTGARPEDAVRELDEAGADIIGANCGQGIEGYIPICERIRAATAKPVWMKPNAGLPKIVDGKTVYDIQPETFASHVPALIKAGAAFVGGCCGTSPDFIRATCRVVAR